MISYSEAALIYLAIISILAPFAWWIHCVDKKQFKNSVLINESINKANKAVELFSLKVESLEIQIEILKKDLEEAHERISLNLDLINHHHPKLD